MFSLSFLYRGACAVFLGTALAGCANLSQVTPEGTTDEPVWPNPNDATFRQGAWPTPDAFAQVRAGMSKDQLYALLGRPHFQEGLVGVREWDYLFHLPTADGGTRTCQYKVLFDKDVLAASFHRLPADCPALGE